MNDFEKELERVIEVLEDFRLTLDWRYEQCEDEFLTPQMLSLLTTRDVTRELIQKIMEVSTYE